MNLIYTGIGSRATPKEICNEFYRIGAKLASRGFLLRSGGADGADLSFETGCKSVNGAKEIYLPWKGFNANSSLLYPPSKKAYDVAELFHPCYNSLNHAGRALMARNSHQVLGHLLDSPTDFIVSWTPNGEDGVTQKTTDLTGGTGQAIRIGAHYGIPIFNFGAPNVRSQFLEFLEKQYPEFSFEGLLS